jgi:DNA-binding response OmpR family regulator
MHDTRERPVLELANGRAIDLEVGSVSGPGGTISLTTKERALVEYLSARPGQEVARDELLEVIWGSRSLSRAADATVARLRKKIEEDPNRPITLQTLHGHGYRWVGLAPRPSGVPSDATELAIVRRGERRLWPPLRRGLGQRN